MGAMPTTAIRLVETSVGSVGYRRRGTGPPLLMLHGGWSDGRSWLPQLGSLSTDYDVIAWDAPGCGMSPDPSGDLTLADYADAAADLVAALEVGPLHLVGHSFGAGLAFEVYNRHRDIVRSLVLSGAYAGWRGSLSPDEVAARLRGALAELERPPSEWVDGHLSGFFGSSVSPQTVADVRTMMLDVRPAGARPMLTAFASADLRHVLPTITVPTLLIYGAEDVRAPRSIAETLHTRIPGSQLTFIPDAGHDVNLEKPAEYDAAVRTFLRSLSAPTE